MTKEIEDKIVELILLLKKHDEKFLVGLLLDYEVKLRKLTKEECEALNKISDAT